MGDRSFPGVILSGGQSRRMGSGDKAFRLLAGKPLIAHVIERLAPQTAGLAINANGDPARFAAFGLPVIADPVDDFQGPLAGVLAAVLHAKAAHPSAHAVLTAACDAPFLPLDLAGRLAPAQREANGHIAVAQSGGRLHPVFALWPLAIEGALRYALAKGERTMHDFIGRHDAVAVDFPFEQSGSADTDPFTNLNTEADFSAAEIRLGHVSDRPLTKP